MSRLFNKLGTYRRLKECSLLVTPSIFPAILQVFFPPRLIQLKPERPQNFKWIIRWIMQNHKRRDAEREILLLHAAKGVLYTTVINLLALLTWFREFGSSRKFDWNFMAIKNLCPMRFCCNKPARYTKFSLYGRNIKISPSF